MKPKRIYSLTEGKPLSAGRKKNECRNERRPVGAESESHGRAEIRKWQMWKLNNPSMNELVVIGILSRLGFDQQYEREARVASSLMTVDFFFPEKRKAIEVNGRIHQVFDAEQRLARQHQKLALLESERIQCLQIEYLEFCDVRQVISKIREFLQ